MPKVYARNKQFNGVRAGVTFVDGKAETDDSKALHWFKSHGYSVETVSSVPTPAVVEPDTDQTEKPAKRRSKKK